MDKALPDALVTGYEHLIDSIELPDRDDRHVFAAAIHCRARVIVTLNLGDFPAEVLGKLRIEAQHPDDFVLALLEGFPDLVMDAATTHRMSLKNSAKTLDEYLAELNEQGLIKTVVALRELGTYRQPDVLSTIFLICVLPSLRSPCMVFRYSYYIDGGWQMSEQVCMTNPGPQKLWSRPKLKKIDIETITAANFVTNSDGATSSTS